MNIRKFEKLIGAVGILIPTAILLAAETIQFFVDESPCPLCMMQRAGFIGFAITIVLYLRFGHSNKFLGLGIIIALAAMAVSTRQILLHITSAHGKWISIFGLHMYTWSFLALAGLILFAACLIILDSWHD
jgi:disulfide bond formation protein DsbB